MDVIITWKRNCHNIERMLDERVRRMIQLCADDLTLSGWVKGKLNLIFQTGKSRAQKRLYGLCCYFRPTPTIIIYTRYQRLKRILDTIAHEFGHVSHFVLYPESHTHWCANYHERFANKYAAILMERWEGAC